jgi:catechol 2,3-dioxygenase-like lactoylglutathione lyase family enzyme
MTGPVPQRKQASGGKQVLHVSPLWPAQLDHIRIDSDDPDRLVSFYRDALGMAPVELGGKSVLLQAPARRIIVGEGLPRSQPYMAFRVRSEEQLDALRRYFIGRSIECLASPTPVFGPEAFSVRDPDGRLVVFGVPRSDLPQPGDTGELPAAKLPGRLQHVVVASSNLPTMLRFYEEDLGFVVSDYVFEDEAKTEPTVGFFRSDPEHHSFAVFRCPETRPDHHAYETTCWNDIRDWADHLSTLNIKLWWGPGRHGPGNNLFFMIQDPQGYLIEISAELEVMPDEVAKRAWKHEERTLNLWGPGFMRS